MMVTKKEIGPIRPATSPPPPRPKASKTAKEAEPDELVRIPILLKRSQALRLKAMGANRHATVSDLVRDAVERYLELSRPASSLTKADIENLLKER